MAKKSLPTREKTLDSTDITEFFRDVITQFEEITLIGSELVTDSIETSSERLISTLTSEKETIGNESFVNPAQPITNNITNTNVTNEGDQSSSTSNEMNKSQKTMRFLQDVFFKSIYADGIGEKISNWQDQRRTNKLEQNFTSNETNEPNEMNTQNNEYVSNNREEDISYEDELEQDRIKDKEITLLEDIRDGIYNISDGSISKKDDEKGSALGGLLAGAGSMLLGKLGITSVFATIKKGLLTGVKKMFGGKGIMKLITKFFAPVAIVTTIGAGLIAGFKEFQKSGSIKDAIITGLGGMLEWLSFGLFSKEQFAGVIEKIGDFTNDYIIEPIKNLLLDILSGVRNKINEFFGYEPEAEPLDINENKVTHKTQNELVTPEDHYQYMVERHPMGEQYMSEDEKSNLMNIARKKAIENGYNPEDTSSNTSSNITNNFTNDYVDSPILNTMYNNSNDDTTTSNKMDSMTNKHDFQYDTTSTVISSEDNVTSTPIVITKFIPSNNNSNSSIDNTTRTFEEVKSSDTHITGADIMREYNAKKNAPNISNLTTSNDSSSRYNQFIDYDEIKSTREEKIQRMNKLSQQGNETNITNIASDIGKNIKVNVPPTPPAPQQEKSKEVVNPPFSQRLKNSEPSFNKMLESNF